MSRFNVYVPVALAALIVLGTLASARGQCAPAGCSVGYSAGGPVYSGVAPGYSFQAQSYSAAAMVPVRAGLFRMRTRCVPAATCRAASVRMAPVQPPAPSAAGYSGDAAGFLGWLNGLRARHGLGPVAWDADLAAWASENSRVGFGHAVRCGRRQNSGVGTLEQMCSGWLASPAHYAALVDPSVTRIGLAAVGSVWTLNLD